MTDSRNDLGEVLKLRRVMMPLTLHELSARSGVSPSYLGRIERGDRFPSGRILRKLAEPLGFEETELLALAGYLSSPRLPLSPVVWTPMWLRYCQQRRWRGSGLSSEYSLC